MRGAWPGRDRRAGPANRTRAPGRRNRRAIWPVPVTWHPRQGFRSAYSRPHWGSRPWREPQFAVGYAQNEIEAGHRLNALGNDLPAKTTVIKSELGVEKERNGECNGVVAKVLATELSGPDVIAALRHRAASPRGTADPLSLAYYSRGAYRVESARAPSDSPSASELPVPIRALFDQYAFLPGGVRRVILFQTYPVKSAWDPRC